MIFQYHMSIKVSTIFLWLNGSGFLKFHMFRATSSAYQLHISWEAITLWSTHQKRYRYSITSLPYQDSINFFAILLCSSST